MKFCRPFEKNESQVNMAYKKKSVRIKNDGTKTENKIITKRKTFLKQKRMHMSTNKRPKIVLYKSFLPEKKNILFFFFFCDFSLFSV